MEVDQPEADVSTPAVADVAAGQVLVAPAAAVAAVAPPVKAPPPLPEWRVWGAGASAPPPTPAAH
eukprot:6336797-Lingulodinium_polyedra.AAC.1